MLKKLANRIFGTQQESAPVPPPERKPKRRRRKSGEGPRGIVEARVIERDEHCISRQDISRNALKILYTLRDEGYHGYLVGGGVRDLLLEGKPKDFDIATDATPEQVKSLFKRSMIIGRRFKIVHVRFGREIIEVTTFRAPHDATNTFKASTNRKGIRNLDSAHSNDGMILRDNVYGDIDEDALRRDFTVNALYYTIDQFRVFDFCAGMEDLDAKLIRMIGNPSERYHEDPVRMLRAIRLAAKLGFTIEAKTREPINQLAPLLEPISKDRLFNEVIKMLSTGYGVDTFALLREFSVCDYLFPDTIEAMTEDSPETRLVTLALRNTDKRLAQGKSVTPAFMFAALLWPVFRAQLAAKAEPNNVQEYIRLANAVLLEQLNYTAIPKRFSITAKEVWELQIGLTQGTRKSAAASFNHPRFRAAYDFLLLREEAGEDLGGAGSWWTDYQSADSDQKEQMIASLSPGKRPRRRRTRKKSGGTANSSHSGPESG